MNPNTVKHTRRDFLRTAICAAPALALWPGESVEALAAPTIRPSVDLDFIKTQLPLKRRAEWTHIEPRPGRLARARVDRYDRITIHHEGCGVNTHTDEQRVMRNLDGILGWHIRRDFGDIGYHFAIDYAGRVWECRSLGYWGAHVYGHNERNIGVVLLGNFERQRPSDAQMETMEHLVHVLRHHYRVRRGRIYGHVDLGPTLCPGRYLYPNVQKLNRMA